MEIPVKQLDEGIRLCAQNINRFVLDAERLLQDGSHWHAVALAGITGKIGGAQKSEAVGRSRICYSG